MSDVRHVWSLYDRFGLDPLASEGVITEQLRDLAERATPDERDAIRAAWEALATHPRKRLEEALATFPEVREPLGRAPRPVAAPAPSPLTATDLVPRPRLRDSLPEPSAEERALLGPPMPDEV